MPSIIAIDYGEKRTGIAITDPFQIIASPLETVQTVDLLNYLKNLLHNNEVEEVLIGQPFDLKGNLNPLEDKIVSFISKLKLDQPDLKIKRMDERFTSVMAKDILLNSGKGKKKRREKGSLDKISASLLLSEYLTYKSQKNPPSRD